MKPLHIVGAILVTSLPFVAEAQPKPEPTNLVTQATIDGQKFVIDYVTDDFVAGLTNTSPTPASFTPTLTITRNPCIKLEPNKNWDGTKCTGAPYCTGHCVAFGPETTYVRKLATVKLMGKQSVTIEEHELAYGPITSGVIKVLQEGKTYPVTKQVAGVSP